MARLDKIRSKYPVPQPMSTTPFARCSTGLLDETDTDAARASEEADVAEAWMSARGVGSVEP